MNEIVARSARTGIGYTAVDWSTQHTGYVYVWTEKGSFYVVRVSNVVPLNEKAVSS